MNTQQNNWSEEAAEISDPPTVSIGVPVYDGARYLPQAIDSLLSQSFSDFEIVISDNASTDDTESICREYARKDSRIRYIRQPENLGAYVNFTLAFQLSRGKYFKWAAVDDLCGPTLIQRCVEILDSDDSVLGCYARTAKIDSNGRRLWHLPDPTDQVSRFGKRRMDASSHNTARRFLDVLLTSGWAARSYGVFRSSALQKTDLMRETYGWEKVFMAQLALMGRMERVPEVLFFQRLHEKASSNLKSHAARRFFASANGSKGSNFPRFRLLCGYLSSVFRYPAPMVTRGLCMLAIGRYLLQASKWPQLFIDGPLIDKRSQLYSQSSSNEA